MPETPINRFRDKFHLLRLEVALSELDYFRGVVKEQQEIIKQLNGDVLDVEYIHPLDLMELLEKNHHLEMTVWTNEDTDSVPTYELDRNGVKFKQSVHIPARTGRFV